MEAVLTVSNISKRFGKNTAVDKVSLEIEKGEILGLLGPNGAGKTTLAKLLVGLERADTGNIFYFGQRVDAGQRGVRERIAMVPQEPAFYRSFTVRQNIKFFASLYGGSEKASNKKAEILM